MHFHDQHNVIPVYFMKILEILQSLQAGSIGRMQDGWCGLMSLLNHALQSNWTLIPVLTKHQRPWSFKASGPYELPGDQYQYTGIAFGLLLDYKTSFWR